MYVTLEVSKLSGWLNAAAHCRVERRAYDAERGVGRGRGGVGRRQRTSSMHAGKGPGCEGWWAYRACAECTKNMKPMFVTLDVSKLSGWLNFDAICRVERRAYDAERGVGREAGRRGPAAARERRARGEGSGCEGWGG